MYSATFFASTALLVGGDTATEIQDKTKDRLIEELRLHQIELEMQNEDLKRTQDELVKSKDKYNKGTSEKGERRYRWRLVR